MVTKRKPYVEGSRFHEEEEIRNRVEREFYVINLSRYKEITEPLLRVKLFQVQDQAHATEPRHVMTSTMEVTFPDIYHYGNIQDGIDFFKAIIVKYEEKKKDDLPARWDTLIPKDKLLEPIFRWISG